jgi:hypothetical protein
MKDHQDDCKCGICENIKSGMDRQEALNRLVDLENKAMLKHGFYVHLIADDFSSPTNFNAHSHGMESFDHLDFQLIVPLPNHIAHNIISTLVERVKSGERFFDGQRLDKIIQNFEVKLIEATESDRKVFRIVLPDPNGKLELEEINEQYIVQYQTN